MQKGLDFVDRESFNDALFMRVGYEPYRLYMSAQLETGGLKWENALRIHEIKASALGAGCAQYGERMYPLQMAALNVQEKKFHSSMATLLEPTMWLGIVQDDDPCPTTCSCSNSSAVLTALSAHSLRARTIVFPSACSDWSIRLLKQMSLLLYLSAFSMSGRQTMCVQKRMSWAVC